MHSSNVSKSTLSKFEPGSICIVLIEIFHSILREPSHIEYEAIKKLFSEAGGVLWITRGSALNSTNPDGNLVTGLIRTLRTESGKSMMVTLDLDDKIPLDGPKVADLVLAVFSSNFMANNRDSLRLDAEYAERDGVLMIPRIQEDAEWSDFVDSRSETRPPEDQPFYQSNRPLRMVCNPGFLDSLQFVDDERAALALPEDQVDIEVKAIGVNFRDVMMAMGQIEMQNLGRECSGIVRAVGNRVDELRVGDRVASFADGSFANFSRWPANGVQKIPEGMTFEEAAALPIVLTTAYHAIKLANLSVGETVLIHAAAGSLGQALLTLCHNMGATVIATVGSSEKREFLKTRYGLSDHHIFSSRDPSFADGIMEVTNMRGVDVIFNSLSGDLLRTSFECIASFGRFIELGKRDITINTRLEMRPFERNVTFSAVDLVFLLSEKQAYTSQLWAEVMILVRNGVIGKQPLTIFPISEVERALRTMQSGRHIGKLVVVPKAGDIVKVGFSLLNKQRF